MSLKIHFVSSNILLFIRRQTDCLNLHLVEKLECACMCLYDNFVVDIAFSSLSRTQINCVKLIFQTVVLIFSAHLPARTRPHALKHKHAHTHTHKNINFHTFMCLFKSMLLVYIFWHSKPPESYNQNFIYLFIVFSLPVDQVVQDLPPPISFDLPMVLIKPPQACSTAEVYKVIYMQLVNKLHMEII